MAKVKTIYYCQDCAHESTNWLGQCPSCGAWNSYAEEFKDRNKRKVVTQARMRSEPVSLNDVSLVGDQRIPSGIPEFDRVLGGGIVPGSMVSMD